MLHARLIPIIKELKIRYEKNKEALVGFFPKSVIERACFEYAQQQLKRDTFILAPTHSGLSFYRTLANAEQLKAIIFEQEKLRFAKELPLLVGDNLEKAGACLQRFRLSRLKKGYQPGVFTEHLQQNKLLEIKKPTDIQPMKKVRFA